jgi:hypothetical protein
MAFETPPGSRMDQSSLLNECRLELLKIWADRASTPVLVVNPQFESGVVFLL